MATLDERERERESLGPRGERIEFGEAEEECFFSLSRESSLRIGRSTKRMGCLRSDDTGTSVLFDTIFGSYISNFQRNRREEIRDLRMMSDEREEKARCFSDGVSKSPRYPGACIIHIFTPNILIIIILIFVRDGPLEEERAHALKRKKKKKHGAHTRISLHFSRSFSAIGSSADT